MKDRLRRDLRDLMLVPGLSGHEERVAAAIRERLGVASSVDRLGNVIASFPGDPDKPSVMVFTHMDQLGFFVRKVEADGLIRVERMGGVSEKAMAAQVVTLCGRHGDVPGIIMNKAHHATGPDEKYKVLTAPEIRIDTGHGSKAAVEAAGITIGTPVVYRGQVVELAGDRIAGTSVDDRAGCAVLLALAAARKGKPGPTLHCVWSVQEEYNLRGVLPAATALRPDIALQIDLLLACDTPDMTSRGDVTLGGGPGISVFDQLQAQARRWTADGIRVVIAAWTRGSRERLGNLLREHGFKAETVESWDAAGKLPRGIVGLVALGLERGFIAERVAIISEQDLLGERISRPPRRRKRADQFIAEATEIAEGDLVVHQDHGIGRYDGLVTLQVNDAPHDCLRLLYDGGDKLFLPVENIEMLSRFGSETAGASLDKLGGASWQARKAKMKSRIRDMAGELIRIAAARQMREADAMVPQEGAWDEFCARFPFAETEDQSRAISDVLEDLASGRPMDRLICGDVGFGKTEVALRAAFVAAMAGSQVAVVVPTTLLSRQHFRTFTARFADLPIKIGQLSRMVNAKDAAAVRAGVADGTINIVIGTHALLAKSVSFAALGLLIVDEEQHFGVAHKEKLKAIKEDVHVLTLTATPIPRTLQLALTGVREMSLIATPPVDRLAVRTFIMPFDGVVIREALQRERFRGGQVFCVVPRVEDLDRMATRLREIVPEARMIQAHGRLAPSELERVMTAFGDGKYDILLSTNIIESGLDMPAVNTLVIHRADMFGLGQLYQLRGRVGRGKQRGYAYLTWPPSQRLSASAEKRLAVMQTLDALGAGFTLASHDLDIRGAGNLLGDEQSGHIREVGIELYQQMLEDAVAEQRAAKGRRKAADRDWTPNINLGLPVLIPETYVRDLPVRLGLYRRIGALEDDAQSEAMAAELVDRFGPLPEEVENLLQVVSIKRACRAAGVEKLDSGPKGMVLSFRGNAFGNPAGLISWLSGKGGTIRLRPDHKLAIAREMKVAERVRVARDLVGNLERIGRQAKAA